jgi:hypothetical protein
MACAHCAASISLSVFAVTGIDIDIGDDACVWAYVLLPRLQSVSVIIMPANFEWGFLISAALSGSRIIHLRLAALAGQCLANVSRYMSCINLLAFAVTGIDTLVTMLIGQMFWYRHFRSALYDPAR